MTRLDKYGSPYFDEAQVDAFFNDAYHEWIKLKARRGEYSDENRQALGILVQSKDHPNTKTINLDSLGPAPERIWAVLGNFNITCNGVTTLTTRPIVPIHHDRIGEALSNPFEQPEDMFPVYTQKGTVGGVNTLTIYSDSTPVMVEVVWIKEPVPMNSATDPSGFIEIGKTQQYEVIALTLQMMEINIENPFRAQAVGSTEIVNL